VAGLYAEGRVEVSSRAALTIPGTAVVRDGDRAFAWRLKDRSLEKVALNIGDRDPRSGEFVLKSGLSEGDTLIRYPAATLQDGQPVELAGKAESPVLAERSAAGTDSGK
jgi:membrane fusion protein (multidrug efflux system)